MSQCSKELDPLFDKIGDHALAQSKMKKDSPEWNREEEYLKEAWADVQKIFKYYNPGFRSKNDSEAIMFMQAKRNRKKETK